MKYLLILLLFPFIAPCQTVHIDDEKINYKGEMKANGFNDKQVADKIQTAITIIDKQKRSSIAASKPGSTSKYIGTIRLKTPYPIIRTFSYSLSLKPVNGGLEYEIGDVVVSETKRGEATKKVKDKDIIEGLESSGKVAMETEKILNEIDMNIQKILAILQRQVSSSHP